MGMSVCKFPSATSLALNLAGRPYSFLFSLSIIIEGNIFTVIGGLPFFHAPFSINTSSSLSIAMIQFLKKNFIIWFEKQSGYSIKNVHGDNGSEFTRAFEALEKKGLETSTSTVYTPQSNGLVERTHSVLLASIRSCLHQSNLPQSYWNYALKHLTNCRNLVPHSVTKKTPFEVVFGNQSPDVRHIRPFGCKVHFRPPVKSIDTFAPRMENGINLCHEKGGIYRIKSSSVIIRTKHVTFFENEFPGTSSKSSSSSPASSDSEASVDSSSDGYDQDSENSDDDNDSGTNVIDYDQ